MTAPVELRDDLWGTNSAAEQLPRSTFAPPEVDIVVLDYDTVMAEIDRLQARIDQLKIALVKEKL